MARGDMQLDDWLRFAAELGLDGVEASPMYFPPLGPSTPAELRQLSAARGLQISNFTCYSDFTHPDPATRESEVAAMLENVRTAALLGSPNVRILAGQRWPGVSRAEGVDWVVAAARQVAAAAEAAGLQVVLENHTQAFTWRYFDFAMAGDVFAEILDRLADTPVRVQFDTANPLVTGEDTLTLFERVKDRIGYVHLNDVPQAGVFEFVPVGTGIAPNRTVLAALKRAGYTGWIGIEEASGAGAAGYRQAVTFARQVWDEV
jgi:sugar phosphate isomerase/epimerase